jgi:hypothetical protein
LIAGFLCYVFSGSKKVSGCIDYKYDNIDRNSR